MGGWGKLGNKGFITCTINQILIGWSSQGECDGRDMYYSWEKREMHTKFWSEHL